MNKWKVFKGMMKVGMFLTILFIVFQVGVMYINYQNEYEDGTIIKFLTYKEKDVYQTLNGRPSDDFIAKANMYNSIVRTVYVAMFFFVMFEIFDYKEDPKEHWSTILKEKLEKLSNKVKIVDDEEDKDDK